MSAPHSAITAAPARIAIPVATATSHPTSGELCGWTARGGPSHRIVASAASTQAPSTGPSSNSPTAPSSSRIPTSSATPITVSASRAGAPAQSPSQRRRMMTAASASEPITTASAAAPST